MIKILKNLFKRFFFRRLRQILRGHRYLQKSNSLGRINAVKRGFEKAAFYNGNASYSRLIFGTGVDVAEIIVRQYLLNRVADLNLNKSLLFSLGKPGTGLIHQLPSAWLKICEQHGYKVSKIRSYLAWHGFVLMMLAYGIVSIALQTLKNFRAVFQSQCHTLGQYVYFDTLTSGNLPKPCKDGLSHDIITWYHQWTGRVKKLDNLCHGVKGIASSKVKGIPVISIPSAIPPLTRLSELIGYIGWGIAASTIAIADLFRGRWWHALMLLEASKSTLVRLQPSNKLAREYLFHNSNYIYRPLWTYEAERKGSHITLYFYSTNCEVIKRLDGYPPPTVGWKTATWPRYLVFDKYQEDFIRRSVEMDAIVTAVGSIWFSSSPNELPVLPPKSIIVFDVQPVRDVWYQTLGAEIDYYIPDTCNQFLIDIFNSLKKHDVTMVLKRKREIGKLLHYKYRNFLSDLEKQSNFIEINNLDSAQKSIEKCIAVISMPFTTTAHIGREQGKPSVYYYPNGLIQKDDRAAHGIEILIGPAELDKWLSSIITAENYLKL